MAEDAGNYTASALLAAFHDVHHYDLQFKPVSSTFNPQSTSYLFALVQLAWPILAVAVITVFACACRLCCCKPKKHKAYRPSRSKPLRVVAIVAGLLACGAIAATIYANTLIEDGVDDFTTSTTAIDDLVKDVMSKINDTAQSADALAVTVESTSWPTQETQEEADQLASDLRASASQMSSIVAQGVSLDLAQFNDDIDKYDGLRSLATLCFVGVLMGFGLIAVIVVFCRSLSASNWAIIFSLLALFFCWLLAAIEFPLSVGLADFCVDPNKFISDTLSDDVATYYVNCDPAAVSPFQREIDDTFDYLAQSKDELEQISSQTNETYPEIMNGINQINESATTLINSLACNGVHMQYVSAVGAICDDAGTGIIVQLFSHAASGLMFLLVIIVMFHLQQFFRDEYGFYVGEPVDTSASMPLLGGRRGRSTSKAESYL